MKTLLAALGRAVVPRRPQASPRGPQAAQPVGAEALPMEEFERMARTLFMRLQAAHDAHDDNELKRFILPELLASLQDSDNFFNGPREPTEVLELRAHVHEATREAGHWIVAVHFQGLLRERGGSVPTPLDELWQFVRPLDGHHDWMLATIAARM